jgi:hypothetical protein
MMYNAFRCAHFAYASVRCGLSHDKRNAIPAAAKERYTMRILKSAACVALVIVAAGLSGCVSNGQGGGLFSAFLPSKESSRSQFARQYSIPEEAVEIRGFTHYVGGGLFFNAIVQGEQMTPNRSGLQAFSCSSMGNNPITGAGFGSGALTCTPVALDSLPL